MDNGEFLGEFLGLLIQLLAVVIIPAVGVYVAKLAKQGKERMDAELGESAARQITEAVRLAVLATEQLASIELVADKLNFATITAQNLLDDYGITGVNANTIRILIEAAVRENFNFDLLLGSDEE